MTPLMNRDEVKSILPQIATEICGIHGPRVWPDIPEKPVFAGFIPRRVIKKGQTGKEKSIKGYVWLDTDPIAQLFNKFVVGSCHTLDSRHDFKAGNFNHLFNPYMACVFAGADSPDTTIEAKSPSTKIKYGIYDGKVFQCSTGGILIRKHQAVANVFYGISENARPYVVLCRVYDSCAENPWAYSMIRYVRTHAKIKGYGFALGIQNLGELKGHFPDFLPTVTCFGTPHYSAFGDRAFMSYGDDNLTYGMCQESGMQAAGVHGYIIDYAPESSKQSPIPYSHTKPFGIFFNSDMCDLECVNCHDIIRYVLKHSTN